MGVLDLKTDLSKYRKPLAKSVVKQADESGVNTDFAAKQPLLKLAEGLPDRSNNEKNPKKTTEKIRKITPADGRHQQGIDVPKTIPAGRHITEVKENIIKPTPTGRHEESTVKVTKTDSSIDRKGVDVNPSPATPVKPGQDVDSLPATPTKKGQDVELSPATPIKKGTDAHLLPPTPTKTTDQLSYVNFFNDIASGTRGFVPYMDKTLYIGIGGSPGAWTFTTPFVNTQLGIADYFKNDDSNGFTTFQTKTQYKQITGPIGAKEFSSGYLNTQLGYTDFFKNDDASGFWPLMQSTKYIGITGVQGSFQFTTQGNLQAQVGKTGAPQSFADGHSGTIITGKQKGFQPTDVQDAYSQKDTYGDAVFKDYTGIAVGGVIIRNNRYSYKTDNWYKDFVPREAQIGISPLTKIYKIPQTYSGHLDEGNRPWLGTPNRIAAPEVNYFNGPGLSAGIDDAAIGFKKLMTERKSLFIGIDEDKYFYPNLIKHGKRLMELPLDPSDASQGIAKLEAGAGEDTGTQLGIGSPFKSWSGDTKITGQPGGTKDIKIFTPGGYDSSHKYGGGDGYNPDSVKGRLKSVYTDGSPIDGIYAQYNLRDEAYNSTYMKQPFIVRGIQKDGVLKNQRWGLGNFFADANKEGALPPGAQGILQVVSALDGGFIRGGISTAIHRSVTDTVRIAKFLVSPKGITWLVTQVGLQMSNPNVERFPIVGNTSKRPTKLYNLGINTLTSVIGSAFGLHFRRHGLLPFGPSPNYETIVKTRNFNEPPVGGKGNTTPAPGTSNRLLILKNQLEVGKTGDLIPSTGLKKKDLKANLKALGPDKVFVGQNIPYLTGKGGPGSVYGIGRTSIKRWMVSTPPNIKEEKHWETRDFYRWRISNQYYHINLQPIPIDGTANPEYDPTYGLDTEVGPLPTGMDSSKWINEQKLPELERRGLSGSLGRNISKDAPADWPKSKNIVERNEAITWRQKYPDKTEHTNLIEGQKPGSLERAMNDTHIPVAGTIKDYAVLSYGNLKKTVPGTGGASSQYSDFRDKIFTQDSTKDYKLINNPGAITGVTFADKNMDSFYGFNKDLNPTKLDRTEFTSSVARHDTTNRSRADKVNMYDFQKISLQNLKKAAKSGDAKDMIEFWFQGPNALQTADSDFAMVFRATVTGITDNFTGNWSDHQMIGRGTPVHTYTGNSRSLSFSFRIAATSREEIRSLWRKLNYLASYTAPDYVSAGAMKSPFLRLTLGGLFQNTPGFLTAVNYTIPDASPWEINIEDDTQMKQVPHAVDVNISFTPVLDYRPTQLGRMYSLSNNGKHTTNPKDGQGKVTKWDNWLDGASVEGEPENKLPTVTATTDAPPADEGENTEVTTETEEEYNADQEQ